MIVPRGDPEVNVGNERCCGRIMRHGRHHSVVIGTTQNFSVNRSNGKVSEGTNVKTFAHQPLGFVPQGASQPRNRILLLFVVRF